MAGLLKAYQSFLTNRPFVGNIATSAVLFGAGDVIAQQAVEKTGWEKHDWARTGRIVTWGGCMYAPVVTAWFKLLNKVPMTNKIKGTAIRVAADQFISAPIVLPAFFTAMTLMEGGDMNAVEDKIKKQLWPTLTTNWMLFIPFQAVNQSIIPVQYRLLAINLINIPWNTFLSLQNAKGAQKELIAEPRKEL